MFDKLVHFNGSSHGGKNTNLHVLINERMQLLKVILTGGQIHDSEATGALLKGIKLKDKIILADKAYSCERIRVFLAEHGAVACIPDKANFRIIAIPLNMKIKNFLRQVIVTFNVNLALANSRNCYKHDFDSELYKQRNLVERFFQRIKNY